MSVHEWLSVLRQEYLQGFIQNGGAAVKFVVPQGDTERQQVLDQLSSACREDNYLVVSIDSATTRLHLVDKLFHDIAKQICWDDLAYNFLCTMLLESHYLVPADREEFNIGQIAYLNGLDLGEMRAIINNRLREHLMRDYAMTQEFRTAMLKLCQAQLDPHDLGFGVTEAIKEWLRGELQLISALRSASIFQKVGRHNGRELLSSLAHWLKITGRSGLVLTLDIAQFMEYKRPTAPDTSLFYTSGAVVDGYEVLRQFIDSTDELRYCLIVVLAPPSFLTDEQRGVRKYDALYFRIWDEVHDRRRINPLASLVRIARQEAPVATEIAGRQI